MNSTVDSQHLRARKRRLAETGGKQTMPRNRKATKSPQRSNFFRRKSPKEGEQNQEKTVEKRLGQVPLDQDEAFLTAVKTELLGLRKRLRHETL